LRKNDSKGEESSGLRLASALYPTQQVLMAGIRRGEDAAIRQLFTLYAPMLREEARKLGVPAPDREDVVCTLLDDIVMRVIDNPIAPPALTTYIVKTLRNRVRTHHRDSMRERSTDQKAYAEYGVSSEMIVAECHSEYGIRTATGGDMAPGSSGRSVLTHLANVLARKLSLEDRILIVGVDRLIPLRHLATELGVSHGAARVRLSRLRHRIGVVAVEYADALPPAEKQEVLRFLRRANVVARGRTERPPLTDRTSRSVDREEKS
jgi:DNA-directed RNA polymerase specialized sigma24 family protein